MEVEKIEFMEKERGKWEDDIQSKLYDFEVDVQPEDWETIAGKLPVAKSAPLRRHWRYISAAAAVVTLLLMTGGIYFSFLHGNSGEPSALVEEHVENSGNVVDGMLKTMDTNVENGVDKPLQPVGDTEETVVDNPSGNVDKTVGRPFEALAAIDAKKHVSVHPIATERRVPVRIPTAIPADLQLLPRPVPTKTRQSAEKLEIPIVGASRNLMADASSLKRKGKPRRFGFGVGGASFGGFSELNYGNAEFMSATLHASRPSYVVMDEDKWGNFFVKHPREIKSYDYSHVVMSSANHKRPISVGLGVSYYFDDRWALQSGLVYTLLRSEWNNEVGTDYYQRLHYLGVPLSVSYQFAEWRKLRFYVSTGGMVEKNVSGRLKAKSDAGWRNSEKLSMKELVWSLNSRIGASYPIWKFINLYAEGGASYYFDNKSFIETIRSDKPFNVSLQAGFRFGF